MQGDNGASGEADPGHDQLTARNPDPRRGRGLDRGEYPEDRLSGDLWELSGRLGMGDELAAALGKQFGSMLGGIRNGMILSWPGHVAKPGRFAVNSAI